THEAAAVPAFARQTGMACNACHFQHFPVLNAFGRAFKADGFTLVGGESLIEGDLLSLPATLNASLVTKIRYQDANGDAETAINKGEIQFPDEAALLIGGRAGEHIGFLLEMSVKDANSFTSFKMPVVFKPYGIGVSVIPYTTDSLGASYGFELLSTGSVRNVRVLEHRNETSAQQYIGTATAATGVALAAHQPLWFANYSAWAPVHDNNASGPYLNYLRGAVTPMVSGWELGAGFQIWNGTTKRVDSGVTREAADAWALDAQAQGMAGRFPLGVYLTYANAAKSDAADIPNMFNSSTYKDKTAWTITGDFGVIPQRVTLAAAYRGAKNGDPNNDGMDSDNATTLGVTYNPTQNMNLQLNHSWYTGSGKPDAATGDQLTTLMLFAAF
ncbi:MAG: hypothetical protein AAB307_01165, partial [Deltaproteobacteria bacterium]